MAQVTKVKEIELIRRSRKTLRYRPQDVPEGAKIVKAYLYIKPTVSTADEDASLVKTILPGYGLEGAITGQGLITDDGSDDQKAKLYFIISETDLDNFELNKPYWLAVKVILSPDDGVTTYPVSPPMGRTVIRVLPAIINSIS